MPGPPKITLAQAKAQGDFTLIFYCVRPAVCSHSGEMRLDAAIARWGGALRLDQVPARCSRCGSCDHVDVRARPLSSRVGSIGAHLLLDRPPNSRPTKNKRPKRRRQAGFK